jgi:NADH:ubiquinone oxidoreductase subunit 3 (subunit A)
MYENYTYVFLFILIGVLFPLVAIGLNELIAYKKRGVKSAATYESGMDPIGSAWVQFRGTYYNYALIFLVFDVETVFLFPAVLAYRKLLNLWEFGLIALFLGILALGIVYAFRKGFLEWK